MTSLVNCESNKAKFDKEVQGISLLIEKHNSIALKYFNAIQLTSSYRVSEKYFCSVKQLICNCHLLRTAIIELNKT